MHKYQLIGGTQKRAYYSGSPLHYNKTEVKTQKKILLDVTIDDEKKYKWGFRLSEKKAKEIKKILENTEVEFNE